MQNEASVPVAETTSKAVPGAAERRFRDSLDLVQKSIDSVSRRRGLRGEDADEFTSWVFFKIIDRDYSVFRLYRGEARMTTYLNAVVDNLYRDFRVHNWGRWRASRRALRLGKDAVMLESLVYRDRFSAHEAIEVLARRSSVQRSRSEYEGLLEQLPDRRRRARFVSLEEEPPGARGSSVSRSGDADLRGTSRRAQKVLDAALADLSDEELEIVKLRFVDGLKIVEVARLLDVEVKSLYPRLARILESLRRAMEAKGIDAAVMRPLLDWPDRCFSVDLAPSGSGDRALTPN